MNPDQLAAAELELAAASRQAGKEALFALAPAVMALLGWLGVRKQRHAVRAALTAQQLVVIPEAGPSVAGGIELDSAPGDVLLSVLPEWAHLSELDGVWVIVDTATDRLVCSIVDPVGLAADVNVARCWAASLQRP